MKRIILTMIICLAGMSLSFVYAATTVIPRTNFTYHEILADRISQPLPGKYECTSSFSMDFELSRKIKRYTNKSGILRFFLFQEGSFSRDTLDFYMENFTGNITLMNFGKYANMSVNFKNAAMRSEYIQISIPFGCWNEYSRNKQENR